MTVVTKSIEIQSKGENDIIDLLTRFQQKLKNHRFLVEL